MLPQPPSSDPPPEKPSRDSWRVILVGRTGLDLALRREPSVELIRVRDSLNAVGELSDPIDSASPRRVAVAVAPDAEPEGDELARFLDALRLVDHDARLLRVGPPRAGYDGALQSTDPADRVLNTLEATEPTPRIETNPPPTTAAPVHDDPVPDPIADQTPAPDPDPEPGSPHQTAHDEVIHGSTRPRSPHNAGHGPLAPPPEHDHDLLIALGDGRPILEPAMGALRARIGRDDIAFTPDPAPGDVPVTVRGRVLGALTCADGAWLESAGRAALEPHARWLGAWLRLEAQQRDLRLSAFTDELTGAWNRRYFQRFLEAAIERSRAARRSVTLLYFDIDDFKQYNDAHGHDAGDEILVESVRLLNSVIRPSDRVCRIGGDEFVVIFYDPHAPRDPCSTPPESIYDIATRFQQQICAHRFPKLGAEAEGTLTISGGLASYPWDGADAVTLLSVADELALQSKRKGKNVITLGQGAESVCRTPGMGEGGEEGEGGNGQ